MFGSTLMIKATIPQSLSEKDCKIIISNTRDYILNNIEISMKKYRDVEIEIDFSNEKYYIQTNKSPSDLRSWTVTKLKTDSVKNIKEIYEISF